MSRQVFQTHDFRIKQLHAITQNIMQLQIFIISLKLKLIPYKLLFYSKINALTNNSASLFSIVNF